MCILFQKLIAYADDCYISLSLYIVCHTYTWFAQLQYEFYTEMILPTPMLL